MAVKERELPAEAWLDLARDAVANGMVFLLLSGGEVLLRRDFFEIYEPLTHMGLIISVYTNGTLVTEEIARRLAEAPPSSTDITLYGATAATYESITGVSGSYASCCSGIETLLAHGVPLTLRATITEQNIGEFEAMRHMAEKWGVPFSADWILSKRRDGAPSDVESCRVSPSDCAKLATLNSTSADGQIEAPLFEVPPSTFLIAIFKSREGISRDIFVRTNFNSLHVPDSVDNLCLDTFSANNVHN